MVLRLSSGENCDCMMAASRFVSYSCYAGSEYADRHDRCPPRFAGADQGAEVVTAPAFRHGTPGAGIEQVVVHLRSIEAPTVDDLLAAPGVTQSGEADIPGQAHLAHALQ